MDSGIEKIRLTQFSRSSGCGCKISPQVLEEILKGEKSGKDYPLLLVGNEQFDDAAVMDIGAEQCLVSTSDFFTPIVDDAYDFGRIAASNALSDIYAMGGKPVLALALLCFPVDKLPAETAREMMRGARTICNEAGVSLAGGHSIDITEPVFGLSVNGLVKRQNIKRNNSARNGDLLYLTKPLGTGIMASALKKEKLRESDYRILVDTMIELNKAGAELGTITEVHAMTDITGFGFLGHLLEMCEGSQLSAEIEFKDLPLLDELDFYTGQFIVPDSAYRNWNAYEKKVQGVSGSSFMPLCDPQTSGGLLVAVDPVYQEKIKAFGKFFNKPIGRMFRSDRVEVIVKE